MDQSRRRPSASTIRMALVALLIALAIGGTAPRSASALDQIVMCDPSRPDGGGVCVITCEFNPDADPLIPDLGEWLCHKERFDPKPTAPEPPPPDPPEPEGGDTQVSGVEQLQAIDRDLKFLAPSGIGGGGAIQTTSGDAQFAISATQVTPINLGDGTPVVRGQIVWTVTNADGSTTTLTSVLVDGYGWIEGTDGGRWARGTMAVDGAGEYPFVLRAVDSGTPGASVDSIELLVGNAIEGQESADFGYHAEGSLVSGDLQVLGLTFDLPENAGS